MKSLVLIFVLFMSATVFADEVVELRADMQFLKCEKQDDVVTNCFMPETSGQPIQISLSAIEGSPNLSGCHTLTSEVNDYSFEAEICISKNPEGQSFRYIIFPFVRTLKGNEYNVQFLGSVAADAMSKLNDTAFIGEKVQIGNSSIAPVIFLGAKDANLEFLSHTITLKR